MNQTPPPKTPTSSSDDDWLRAVLSRERSRHAALEVRRLALGGVYDPILGRWVSVEEANCDR